ncbi:hypothetical protein GBAR_LOCUS12069 [Geodia barretti]|uniref:Uncharacterized protein n=1 Tax=Geodia barretti TaxID=519541 RepID=A0AA35WK81_GEOBA|nr:hypothetical protein GBAR_LOCUS12069 [Geodia barretti]
MVRLEKNLDVDTGKAQVQCYSEGHCPNGQPTLNIGQFDAAKECCIIGEALSWQSGGEPCAACLIYGWKETYSEARIGDTLTLTVGIIKGSPEVRVILGVEYNNTEVSVGATDFDPPRLILAAEDLSLQVTVLDDGQPLQEDKNITLTLAKIAGGKSSDIIVTEAIITVRAQKIPGL